MQIDTRTKDMRIAVLDIGGTSIKSGIFCQNSLNDLKENDTNSSYGGEYVMNKAKEILNAMVTLTESVSVQQDRWILPRE